MAEQILKNVEELSKSRCKYLDGRKNYFAFTTHKRMIHMGYDTDYYNLQCYIYFYKWYENDDNKFLFIYIQRNVEHMFIHSYIHLFISVLFVFDSHYYTHLYIVLLRATIIIAIAVICRRHYVFSPPARYISNN